MLQVHCQGVRQNQNVCPPLIKLLVTELTNPSSALLRTLSKAGGCIMRFISEIVGVGK